MFARFKKLIFPGIAFVAAFAVALSASLGACQETSKPAPIPATVPPTVAPEPVAASTARPPNTITARERDYVREMMKEVVRNAFVALGSSSPITEAEYTDACILLRRNDWDPRKVYKDPEISSRLGGVVGSVNGAMEVMNELAEEKRIAKAKYTLEDFCANVP